MMFCLHFLPFLFSVKGIPTSFLPFLPPLLFACSVVDVAAKATLLQTNLYRTSSVLSRMLPPSLLPKGIGTALPLGISTISVGSR